MKINWQYTTVRECLLCYVSVGRLWCCRTVSCPRYSMFVMRTFPSTCPINSNPFSLWQQLAVISTAMRTPELRWLMHASQLQTLPSWRDTPLHWPLSLSQTPRLWPSTTAMIFLLVSVPTPINLQDERINADNASSYKSQLCDRMDCTYKLLNQRETTLKSNNNAKEFDPNGWIDR